MASILKDIRAAFGDVEAAPYTVVVQRGGYEERVYPARRWACTSMSGPSRHELVTPMFRRLFSYISGRNEPNVRIDMTTPVVTYVEPLQEHKDKLSIKRVTCKGGGEGGGGDCGGDITDNVINSTSTPTTTSSSCLTYTMSFLVPASHQEEPPTTADRRIFFECRKKMSVLVRRFSGYLNDDVVRRELKVLREAIKNNGDDEAVDFSRYYVVGYDPPFKLLGRRNEIWVVKKVWEKEEEEEEEEEEGVKMEKGMCGGDFVMVEKEEEDEELTVVNGVVQAEEKKEEKEAADEENGEEEEEKVEENATKAVVEKTEAALEGKVLRMEQKTLVIEKSTLVEKNLVVVEANGVVGRENGEVVFVENLENQ